MVFSAARSTVPDWVSKGRDQRECSVSPTDVFGLEVRVAQGEVRGISKY